MLREDVVYYVTSAMIFMCGAVFGLSIGGLM